MKTNFLTKVKSSVNKVNFSLKKHSPEILITTGIIGVVASAVMACVSTTKVKGVIEHRKAQINDIHEKEKCSNGEYTEQDKKKELTAVYLRTGLDFVKLYGAPVVLGALSLGSIVGSNQILRKRNAALSAAYMVIDNGFKQYRANVVERFGEEIDKELRYNLKDAKIKEKIIDPKTGQEIEVEKDVKVAQLDPNGYSEYARFYDDGCKGWTKDSEYNLCFLRAQQSYANDLLRANGYLFLNDVYDMLGIPKSRAGQVVGWIYDKNNDIGDNYVDFGIYDMTREKVRDFVNGYERVILLDFNVDGYIMDRARLTK